MERPWRQGERSGLAPPRGWQDERAAANALRAEGKVRRLVGTLAATVALVVAAVIAYAYWPHAAPSQRWFERAPARPQTTWAPPGRRPLGDAGAAALVTHRPEIRPANGTANNYVPTDGQLRAFHRAKDATGQLADKDIPERRWVTGRPGLRHPSTDDLIQWVAHKWGIPEDWIRAQMAVESDWNQASAGDGEAVPAASRSLYPPQARIPSSDEVYTSMGISQVKWRPDGTVAAGTEPLRWRSTAFALDFYAAEIRFFYDGRCSWCGPGYKAGQAWNSIGAWYQPLPWGKAQADYVARVRLALATHAWEWPGF
jgi:hypothetical protein